MGFVWRRSLASMSILSALLVLAGGLVVQFTPVPWTVPLIVGLVFVGLQYVTGPWLVAWLIRATEIDKRDDGYCIDDSLTGIVVRQAQAAGVPLPRLGIIDDGMPNAFTFGRIQRDARIYVSRGLIERLNEAELEAVIAHEVGHIKNRDFIVMNVAAVVPMVLYYIYLGARGNNRADGTIVAVASYVGFLLAQLAVLALSRARELGADHASCARTGQGDALASALVKVAYGVGQVNLERQREARELIQAKRRKEARRLQRQGHRMHSARALGIADEHYNTGMVGLIESGVNLHDALAAMRWDATNPWGRFSEKLSTHPLVVRRIAALETSGLPGAPSGWNAAELLAERDTPEVHHARDRFWLELPVRYLGWIGLIAAVLTLRSGGHVQLCGELLAAAGVILLVRVIMKSPLTGFTPVDRITSLLGRMDASPVTGIPVTITGKVIGRGMPGYVFSPDLVVSDESGFVTVLYTNSVPFARSFFAVLKAGRFAEEGATVRGWYRRDVGPYIELRDVTSASGERARGNTYLFNYLFAVACLAVGAVISVVNFGG